MRQLLMEASAGAEKEGEDCNVSAGASFWSYEYSDVMHA